MVEIQGHIEEEGQVDGDREVGEDPGAGVDGVEEERVGVEGEIGNNKSDKIKINIKTEAKRGAGEGGTVDGVEDAGVGEGGK